jgi:hypothetical protein
MQILEVIKRQPTSVTDILQIIEISLVLQYTLHYKHSSCISLSHLYNALARRTFSQWLLQQSAKDPVLQQRVYSLMFTVTGVTSIHNKHVVR